MNWTLSPALETLRTQINAIWPNRDKTMDGSIGDEAHAARKSDHNPDENGIVTAIDITDDDSVGADMAQLAEWFRSTKDRRIKYVIHEGQLFSSYATSSYPAWTWRPYSGTNQHFKHLHISVTQEGKYDYAPWDLTPFEPKESTAPRRFSRIFELDRNGPPWEGTPEQGAAVRASIAKFQADNSRFDKVLLALDKLKNLEGRSFIPIGFFEIENALGYAYPSRIALNEALDPNHLERTLIHEIGHVIGMNFFNPTDRTEAWAIGFEQWVRNGQSDGPVWDRLKDKV